MNYEEFNKSCFEEAKRLYETANADQKNVLENLFPELKMSEELKKSEDEKIKEKIIEYFENCNIKHLDWIAWLEKQGEQKSADNVEPKFHEGEWIVFNGLILYINEVVQGYYRTTSIDNIPNSYDWNIDNVARLWSIKDAKDGDILAVEPIDDYPFPFIGIYKERGFDFFNSYCFIGFNGTFYKENTGHSINNIHPATKKQCDLLFKKMKEAGYEWNADKKELKKINQNKDIHNKLTIFESSLKHIMEEAIECGDTHNLKADADMLLRLVQNHDWSEEDKKMLNQIISIIESANRDLILPENISLYTNWLKSCKPQKQWKPSEAQISALEWQVHNTFNNSWQYIETKRLLEQLKQL